MEGNEDGVRVRGAAVAKLEGCTVRGNSDDDYFCEATNKGAAFCRAPFRALFPLSAASCARSTYPPSGLGPGAGLFG